MILDEDQDILADYASGYGLTPQEARQKLNNFCPDPKTQKHQELLQIIKEHSSGKIPEDYHYRFQEAGHDITQQQTKNVLNTLVEQGCIGRYFIDSGTHQGDQPYYTGSVYDAVQKQDVKPFDLKPIVHEDIGYNRLKRIVERSGMDTDAVIKHTLESRYIYAQNFNGLLQD